jgi:hypothetical protein
LPYPTGSRYRLDLAAGAAAREALRPLGRLAAELFAEMGGFVVVIEREFEAVGYDP